MAEASSTFPDLETQKNEIAEKAKKPLKSGDVWYLIDNKWFKQWKKYVGYDSWETSNVGDHTTHPGPIDNSLLFRDDGTGDIKDHLIDELDYFLLPQEAWDLLVQWYSIVDGQQPIARKVVEYGMFVKHCKVEVYLLEFKLAQNNDPDHYVTKKFSKADTIEHIENEMRKLFNIPEDKETRLWNRYSSNTYEQLSNKESTVQDAGLYQGQVLIIEQKNDDNTWSRHVKSTGSAMSFGNSTSTGAGDNRPYGSQTSTIATRSYGSVGGGYSNTSYNSYDYHSSGAANVQPGLCGLSNLGNTCFMNSAIQCMSNTPPLTDYFLGDQYWNELNVENPLGMHGEIAKSYGELVKQMWSGRFAYTVPRNFKMIVGRFAPQFSGYQQQDCQELMAFLLDGLHEDLNRVKRKPYIELKDADGRPDEVVSKEAWENYLRRNNSIIVDIFHGLLKSTLVCPECSKISVTFDPFCYLSLPLPIKKEKQIEILFVSADPERRPLKMKVTVAKGGTVHDICEAVSKLTSIPAKKLIVTEIYNHRFNKLFHLGETVSSISDRDEICVYEVPALSGDDGSSLALPVYFKAKRYKSGTSSYGAAPSLLFGIPIFVPIPVKNCTYEMLYNIILQYMARYVKIPDPDDDWWSDGNDSVKINGEPEMTNGEDYDSEQSDCEREQTEDAIDMEENERNHLFTIQTVNSCGNVEVDTFKNDGRALKLYSKTHLAIEWHPKAKEKFYNEKAAMAFDTHESMNTRWSQKKMVIQLNECLELFTTVEKLGADDPWYCPACKRHQQATKKFDLWSLPQVLIIHLKRFSYNRYWRDKLDTLVEFPVNGLNMAKYVINQSHGPAVYDLIAVANHYGGMGGGHYTAYSKNKTTGNWYHFDDSTVTLSSEDSVVSKAAYVLFYVCRDSNPVSRLSSRQAIPAALGAAPSNLSENSSPDDNGLSSSDDDCSMDVN